MTTAKHRTGGRIAFSAIAIAASLGLALTGCSSSSSGSADGGESAATIEPLADRPVPTDQAPEEPVRIAMIGFSNNPYWVSVEEGAKAANDVLSGYDGSVDWIVAGDKIDVQTVSNAINAANANGYQGIGFFIAGEGNCEVIEQLSDEGIAMGAYNTLFDCVETSGGVINYAQEQYETGKNAAKELIAATGDEPGSVGIITSQFTAPGAEQRRKGFIDGLEGSNLKPVGEGVEAHDSASETYTAAQNYLQSTPDLVGIYATAGGPFGAAQAVAAAKAEDQVKVIGFDLSDENMTALRDGSMFAAIGQDAFGQGYNVAIELFNAAVTGEKPSQVMQPSESAFVTQENIDEHDATQQPLGKLGTS